MPPNYLVLKALRLTHRETQSRCAKRVGVTKATIAAWESPTSERLNDRQLARICISYGVSVTRAIQSAEIFMADTSKKRAEVKSYDALRKMYLIDSLICFDSKGEAITLLMALDTVLRDKKLPEPVWKAMISTLTTICESTN